MESLGQYILDERTERGLSRMDLARLLVESEGLDIRENLCLLESTYNKLGRWERDEAFPGYFDIWLIKNVFDCSYDDIFVFFDD